MGQEIKMELIQKKVPQGGIGKKEARGRGRGEALPLGGPGGGVGGGSPDHLLYILLYGIIACQARLRTEYLTKVDGSAILY